jgi:3-phosphoshikimate 1-carboxyvinyltransferase
VVIANVGLNPTRTGLITALRMMGADITEAQPRIVGGEPVADLIVRHAPLRAIEVPPDLAPSMIDEYPALFVAAALAEGRTVARGAHELRVKESDRIATMAAALSAAGVAVEEYEDGLAITGSGGAPIAGLGAGEAQVASKLDHRIAMSMAVAGLAARKPITIDDVAPVATSFPAFFSMVDQLTG